MRVAIVAGESSGDALGAGLIRALRGRSPDLQCLGIGGPRMQAQGFTSRVPMDRLSVMGFVEPLGRLPELLRIKRDLVRELSADPPDVFIGIDSPGFNLRLARDLHERGIRTVQYVSPSVWAWGAGRIHAMARCLDLALTLFPFEAAIYEAHGIPVRCVGHPLADTLPAGDPEQGRSSARGALALPGEAPVLALMPGSRRGEVQRLGAIFLEAAARCLQRRPDMHFVIPCASPERRQQIEQLLGRFDPRLSEHCHLLDGDAHTAMRAADLVLLASGTAALEAMLLKRPMIVAYRLAPLTWMLASRLVRVPHVSLPNLLAGLELVPELLQGAVTVPALLRWIDYWLDSPGERQALYEAFDAIHRRLNRGADDQAADAVTALLQEDPP